MLISGEVLFTIYIEKVLGLQLLECVFEDVYRLVFPERFLYLLNFHLILLVVHLFVLCDAVLVNAYFFHHV